MHHDSPLGYERKFADFIKLCADAKSKKITEVIVANPFALGDNYEEMVESLSRVADAGLNLHIAGRAKAPARN
jgi:dihydrodipicolinate synthase/N-acetylneuraminate lyase